MPLANETREWLETCLEHMGLRFKETTKEFLQERLQITLAENITRRGLYDELVSQIEGDPALFDNFKAFFVSKQKQKEARIKRSYFRFHDGAPITHSFTKAQFTGLISNNRHNDDENKSGFLAADSPDGHITIAKYIHYSVPETYLDFDTLQWKSDSPNRFELDFSFAHNTNILTIESVDYTKKILPFVADLKEMTTWNLEPLGVYFRHADAPTETILDICRTLFDDSWMQNDPDAMRRLEEEHTPAKFVRELFNKNENPIKKVGTINLSKCTLSFQQITSDEIVAALLEKEVAIIGFTIETYFHNHHFTIRVKSSRKFSTLLIKRGRNVNHTRMIELKDKIENLLREQFS